MDFYIKKNATLPVIKLQVVKDGRSDYDSFMKTIELSAIFFSMVDSDTGIPKISSRPAGFVEKTFLDPNAEPEYYIYYQFTSKDTNRVGSYEGQFMLRNDDGVLILPIREKLNINIQDSFIADDLVYDSCYVSEFPCCVNGPFVSTTTTSPCPSCPTCPEPTPTPQPTTTTTTYNPTTTTTTHSPTPTPTLTPTPTPTNTPTPEPEILINPTLVGENQYLSVGDNEYLMFPQQLPIYTGETGCNDEYVITTGVTGSWYITVQLGASTGLINFQYNAKQIPDRFQVYWGGNLVIDTGFRGVQTDPLKTFYNNQLIAAGYDAMVGTGYGTTTFVKTTASPDFAIVVVTAPIISTAWQFTLYCPLVTPTPTVTPTNTPTPTETPTNTPTPTETPTA